MPDCQNAKCRAARRLAYAAVACMEELADNILALLPDHADEVREIIDGREA